MKTINGNGHTSRFEHVQPENTIGADGEIENEPTNGKQTSAPPRAAMRALRVLSIAPGTTYHVMFLSDEYGGCFTHYKKKSHYCKGNDCPAWLHNCGDTVWKGYAPVVVWNAARSVWMPWVLEMTESLELDLRSIVRRGQVWEIWRDPLGKRTSPVEGKLLEEDREPSRIPPMFDIVPVMRGLYHLNQIDLSHRNPSPPRTLVTDVAGDGPAVLNARNPDMFVPPEGYSFAEKAKDFNSRKKTPTEKKTGTP